MKAKQARKNRRRQEKRISCGGIGPAKHGQCPCMKKQAGPGFDSLVQITGQILEEHLEVIRCKR